MKILIVSQVYWPETFRINDLAAELVRRGHQVTVLTGLPNHPDGKIWEGYGWFRKRQQWHDGVEIIRVPLIPRGKGRPLELIFNYLSFATTASLLGPFVCRGDYNVTLVFEVSPVTVGIPAAVIKWIRRIPIAFWVQDLWPESLSATKAILQPSILNAVGALVRLIYKQCDSILVQSEAFKPSIEAMGVHPGKILFLPNSAEKYYLPLPLEECTNEEAELPVGFRVMFAGNIGVAQDFSTILAAAKRTSTNADIHWVIFGDGRLRSWAEEEIRNLGLEATVHLMGFRPPQRIPYYSAVCNALLATLKREPIFALTIPSKIQSYLACGQPILAALEGEGARIIQSAGAGMVCAPEDPDALAATVLALRNMEPEERRAMGKRARACYETEFDRDAVVDRLEHHLANLASKTR